VASRWPQRLPLVAFSSRSTSASVRYSRVRRSALGRRLGVTVRFLAAVVISRRWELAKVFTLFRGSLFVQWAFFERPYPCPAEPCRAH